MEKVFLNDKLVDADKAGIPVNDAGFLYGAGLFETMRACNGVVFSLEDHLERLFSSAHALAIENSQAGAATSAIMGKAKLHGLLIEKNQQLEPDKAENMTDAQLEAVAKKGLVAVK